MTTTEQVRTCRKCGGTKCETTEFAQYKYRGEYRRMSTCRQCQRTRANERNREAVYTEEQRANMRASADRSSFKRYGITQDVYAEMYDRQGGVCKICGEQETRTRHGVTLRLVVDHDHDTGRVRGLLCSNCNVGIGYLKHDVALLHKAIAYLTEKEGEYHRTV